MTDGQRAATTCVVTLSLIGLWAFVAIGIANNYPDDLWRWIIFGVVSTPWLGFGAWFACVVGFCSNQVWNTYDRMS